MSTVEPTGGGARGWLEGRDVSALRDYGIVAAFIILFIVLAVSSDPFLTFRNWSNILDQWSAIGVMAVGWTIAMIAGGFDLSIGAIYALAAVIGAKVAIETDPALGLFVGGICGVAVGFFNGGVVTVGRVHSFIGTLAASFMIRGIALAISGGFLVRVLDDDLQPRTAFDTIGRSELLGVKYSVWVFAGVILFATILLHGTAFGRHIFAVGGNIEAARLSGVRVNYVRWMTFVITGFTASIAGMIAASRVSTGQADLGTGIEFDVIAAVVLGGSSILGGAGAIWRTVVGVLMLAMIQNGFNLLNFDPVYQRIVFGGIILSAVTIDAWTRRSGT